jgi:hypothetical protein
MPRAWNVATLAAVVGAVFGVGGAMLRALPRTWQVGDFRGDLRTPVTGPVGRAEATDTVHDFGTLPAGERGMHPFTVSNVGEAPLRLSRGATSCTCTIAGFAAQPGEAADAESTLVPPGASTQVTLAWEGKGPGGPFRQQATILTDDPRRPEIIFVVEGTVIPSWKAVPESLQLARVSATAGETAMVRVFTFGESAPIVDSLVVDHPRPELFEVSTQPLDSAELAAEEAATGGLLLTAKLQPGLPLGRLRATIDLVLRQPDSVTVTIPLEATIAGDLLLAGRAWNPTRQALMLGTVSARQGLRTEVFLTARGPQRESLRPVVKRVVPDSMEVTVGDPRPVGTGGVVRSTLTVVIPPGARPSNHLCSQQAPAGTIELETGHPDVPELSIPVCVAIGP